MPYQWDQGDVGVEELRLWPHQSLNPAGFALFIGITACLVVVPLIPLLGSVALWGILPFMVVTVGGIWWALQRSWRDNQVLEILELERDAVRLVRRNPRSPDQFWDCNAYWTQASLHGHGGPVPDYITLRGNGREVELGAFLSVEERRALYGDLCQKLSELKCR